MIPDESVLVAAARDGDERAFRRLVEPLRGPIHSLCYQMQRAVLILRDVFSFSAADVAATIGATVPAVNSALQRARRTLEERLPDRSQQWTLRALGDERVREVVDRFVDAFESAELDAILGL